ncbi:hypothetical protein [Microvirga sp. TS319]|uniref:hypothetical protein n=1 Tax=Microvirga sp. TS319 TaxID=3241165 RepID=UPI00351A1792
MRVLARNVRHQLPQLAEMMLERGVEVMRMIRYGHRGLTGEIRPVKQLFGPPA